MIIFNIIRNILKYFNLTLYERDSLFKNTKAEAYKSQEDIKEVIAYNICPYCGEDKIGSKGYRGENKRLVCRSCNKSGTIEKKYLTEENNQDILKSNKKNSTYDSICRYCGKDKVISKGYSGENKRLICKSCNKSRTVGEQHLAETNNVKSAFSIAPNNNFRTQEKLPVRVSEIMSFEVQESSNKEQKEEKNIVLDKDQQYVYDQVMEGKNIFLTGKAGTGKSSIVKKLINQKERILIPLAPTGIAAINLDGKGQTLHSFFSIPLDVTIDNIYNKLKEGIDFKKDSIRLFDVCDGIMIDEISMVRSDMFDILNILCQVWSGEHEQLFGGKQIICVGDLYQLPPIVKGSDRLAFSQKYKSEFFFSSKIFQKCSFETIELDNIYRQNDKQFILTLNNIRLGIVDKHDMDFINQRVVRSENEIRDNGGVTLTPKKAKADFINKYYLDRTEGKLYRSIAQIEGKFPESMYPNEVVLDFKVSCQIMIVRNLPDSDTKNGMIGRIIQINEKECMIESVIVQMNSGAIELVKTMTRDIFKPQYDPDTETMDYESVGSFSQFPFKLGRASTIHKSQGLSLEKVNIDLDTGAFEKGQTYVALSRATSFEGLNLIQPIRQRDIKVDSKISSFMGEVLIEKKRRLIEQAIQENKEISLMYRKGDGTITRRTILPEKIYLDDFEGYDYLRVDGYCKLRNANRHFNIAKIFEIEVI